MKVLIVGGAGHVGTMTLPYMKSHHQFRVLDLSPPKDSTVEYIEGSVTDPAVVRQAVKGMDAFIYMVMRVPPITLHQQRILMMLSPTIKSTQWGSIFYYTRRKKRGLRTAYIPARSPSMNGRAINSHLRRKSRLITPVCTA